MTIWTIARHELALRYRDKGSNIRNFIMPVLLIFLLGSSLSGMEVFQQTEREIKVVKVGVVQQDTGALKKAFEAWTKDERVMKYAAFKSYSDRKELDNELKDQRVDYGIIVPAAEVSSRLPLKLVTIRGNDSVANMTMETMFEYFVSEMGAVQTIASLQPHEKIEFKPTETVSAVNATNGVVVGTTAGRSVSAMQYYSVSILVMFLFYTGLSFGASMYKDRENRTLMRMVAAPTRPYEIALGKMLGHFIVGLVQAAVIVFVSRFVFGVEWHGGLGIITAVAALIIFCSLCIGLLAVGWFKNQETMFSFMQTLIISMVAVSGGYVVIPSIQESIGIYTIPYWGMQSLLDMMMGKGSVQVFASVLKLSFITGIIAVISFLLHRKAVIR
ncbi:ABC transporter permease [Paenibacillus sp. UMB4589-SE434]|uniref:ABC transporter permease n=1 Tax=Paenibacillus sp. UMB4589-SE434 TaxID=3046314 RepID=UPI00254F8058|nr:ABC transporter permease [Paenibacillus sp. UMB4589-SE434]MDK8181946.1 ABC transporter permease [Paenibacillus sp. UMB4589-SE434]